MATPSRILSILSLKCPRCRKGYLFTQKNPFQLKKVLDMHKFCPVCGQRTELEPGFWYGTGYVSYVLSVGISAVNLGWFWILIGITWRNSSILWYLGVNAVILVILQPWLMRLSRVIYLSIFVRYDPEATRNLG
ncbi:MAG TPA: hypothetical protein VMV20_04745 [Chitinophagaceae bacterium]|nr:hypothetical protein [Chitinophagaceae bacterium]